MKLAFERYYPIALAIIATLITGYFNLFSNNLKNLIIQVADNALSISVTLLGFFLTILTIINAIDTRRMKFVKELGGFPRLIKYLRQSITFNLILIGASFIIKYVEHYDSFKWAMVKGINLADYLYLFLFILSMLISFRFTKIFVSVLTDETAPKKP